MTAFGALVEYGRLKKEDTVFNSVRYRWSQHRFLCLKLSEKA